MPSRDSRAVVLAAAVLLLAGCFLLPKEEKQLAPPLLAAPEADYATITAAKGSITVQSSLAGSFVSAAQTPLYFRVSGSRLQSLAVKVGDDVSAGQLVAELDAGSLQDRIAEQKIQLRKAQVVSERAVVMNRDRFERELASLDVDLATLQLKELQDSLAQARLVSPVAGRVVYVGPSRPGDAVQAFQTLVQVDDPRALVLACRGSSSGDFPVGAEVTVTLDDGKTVSGTVTATPATQPSDAPESLRQSVTVRAAHLPGSVSLGDSATVSRLVAQRRNVIVIPRDLVHTYLGRDFVRVLANGLPQDRTVELGIQTATEVEVVAGLAAGEKILQQ